MKNHLPAFMILLVLCYALYISTQPKKSAEPQTDTVQNSIYHKHIQTHTKNHYAEELKRLNTTQYAKAYIVNVINHGSNQLNFQGGEMEEGFASPEDAEKIACYVLEFSDKKCDTSYKNDAAMFYSSICAGCHGVEGKGLHRIYPDLTKEKLLGIQKREDFLKAMIKKTHKEN